MKKIEKIEIECTLSADEAKTIFEALTYVRHRIIKHPGCGARVMSLEKVEKLLEEFEE